MEQILNFVLGASSVILVWGIVVAFRAASKIKTIEDRLLGIENYFPDIEIHINRNDELINRRIDQEIDRVDKLHEDSIRHTDSRIDKLEQKLTGNLGAKELLKG